MVNPGRFVQKSGFFFAFFASLREKILISRKDAKNAKNLHLPDTRASATSAVRATFLNKFAGEC